MGTNAPFGAYVKSQTNADGSTSLVGANGVILGTFVGEQGSPSANYAAIQSAVNAGGTINITAPYGTVIDVDQTILVPSNTTILLSDGITLRKTGTVTTQVFSNSDKVNGNVNIAIVGNATIDGNVAGVTGVVANIRNWNTINMVNVDGLVISGTESGLLTIKGAYKYLLFAGFVRNFRFSDLNFQSEGTGAGKDGLHLAGLSRRGVVERCFGATNDDFIAINPRAIPLNPNETYGVAMGPIKDLVIRDIYGSVRDRSGSVLALYSATFDAAAQTVIDGNPDSATATSTKPAIVSITMAGGVATVTTDKPHRMVQSDPFRISGASPAEYNADYGFVADAPTATTFTYNMSPTAGAYVGSAALDIYWQLDDVMVENVRGNTYQTSIVNLKGMGDTGQVGGIIRNLKMDGVSGSADAVQSAGSNTAVISWAGLTLIDSEIRNISAVENQWMTLINAFNLAGIDKVRTLGRVVFSGIATKTPYLNNQTSSAGPVVLSEGRYEGLVLENLVYRYASNAGSWRQGVLLYMLAGSHVTIRDSSVYNFHSNANGELLTIGKMDPTCVVRLENCTGVNLPEALADIKDGAPVTGGTIILSGGSLPSGAGQAIKCYGNAINVVLDNGFSYFSSNPPVNFLGTSANCTLRVAESVSHTASASATLGGTGPYSVRGLGAKIDVANAKVSRVDGVLLYNTNAAAGTLGTAGLVVGQGTAAGSWHLLADPTKVY